VLDGSRRTHSLTKVDGCESAFSHASSEYPRRCYPAVGGKTVPLTCHGGDPDAAFPPILDPLESPHEQPIDSRHIPNSCVTPTRRERKVVVQYRGTG